MRRYLVLALLLLFPLSGYCTTDTLEGEELTSSATIEGVNTTDTVEGQVLATGGAPSYLFHETWNGDTEDETWTELPGGWDDDYTTSPPEGAQCLYIPESSASMTGTIGSPADEVYVTVMFEHIEGNNDASPSFFRFLDSEDNLLGTFRVYVNDPPDDIDIIRGYYNGESNYVEKTGLSMSTIYLKARYQKGTGANAEWDFYYSTDGKSGNWTQIGSSVTDGSDTAQIAKVQCYNNKVENFKADDIRVDDADINY